jgi:Zn-dependent M16 (insulinase) family peptidase
MGAAELGYEELTTQCKTHSNGFSVTPVIISDYQSLTKVYQELLCSSYCLDAKFTTMMSLWEKIFNQ